MSRQLLGGWTPKDTAQQLQRLTRHSAFVSVGKYGLFVSAALLVALVFIIPALHDGDDGARLVFTNIQVGEAMQPRMVAPKFQGLDEKQQPYKLNAEYADRRDDGSIYLKKIDADITLNGGAWVALFSEDGTYSTEAKKMHMPGAVEMFHDTGYEMRATDVEIDLQKSRIVSRNPVEIQGVAGTLKAKGFTMDGVKKNIVFDSDVVVRLHPRP